MSSSADSRIHWFSFGTNLVSVREVTPAAEPRAHVLLLHGRFGSSRVFQPWIERIGPTFRFLMPDLPGFGSSISVAERSLSLVEHAELAEAIIRNLIPKEESVLVVGMDIGAAIAQMLAMRLPGMIGGIVLMNPSLLTRDLYPRVGWHGRTARRIWKSLVTDSFPTPCEERMIATEAWRDPKRWRDWVKSIQSLEAGWPGPFERRVWAREIAKMQCPVLLLRGSRDHLVHDDDIRELIRELPEVSYFQEPCGHWISLERPEWAASKVREFLFRQEEQVPPVTRARRSLSR